MKTRLRDSGPYWVGFRVEGSGLEIIRDFVGKTEGRRLALVFLMFGEVFRKSGARVRSKVRLVSRHRRSDGLEGRGMRSEATARVISSASARYSAQNGGGSPPGFVSCGVEREGGGRILLLGVAIHRCLPKRHPLCHLPVSPVCSAATGGRPWHSGLSTAFPLRDRARRLPCHLAHMELAAMSRRQGQQSPVRHAEQLVTSQPPIHDNSEP